MRAVYAHAPQPQVGWQVQVHVHTPQSHSLPQPQRVALTRSTVADEQAHVFARLGEHEQEEALEEALDPNMAHLGY
jgi:hypothetical protein